MNTLSRRTFIRNMSVTGGALLLGFNLSGCEGELPAVESEDDFRPDALLSISPQGTVTVLIAKAEMGQGVVTGFITVIAEELEVDPALVNFEMAPAHKAFRDPEMLLQITGASASMRVYYQPLREVGAAARTTLLQAASKTSGIAIGKLSAAEGRVRSADGSYEASYGDLVPVATTLRAGQTGTAITLLRPSGKADIDGQRYDVVTQGDFVPKGSRIRVATIKGTKIVVVRIDTDE